MKETLNNLAKAFIGESMARNRYDMYAKKAKKDGYELVSRIFAETADQEREHAKWLFRMMQDLKGDADAPKELIVESEVPLTIGDTVENLEAAINGEKYEYTVMYPQFAEKAEEEGLNEIAARLNAIAKAEQNHRERYEGLIDQIKAGTMFQKSERVMWECQKCGFIHEWDSPPEKCPACAHPSGYFKLRDMRY